MNISHFLHWVARFNPFAKTSRRAYGVRSAYPAAVRVKRVSAPAPKRETSRRPLVWLLPILLIVLLVLGWPAVRSGWSVVATKMAQIGTWLSSPGQPSPKQQPDKNLGQACLLAEQAQTAFTLLPIPVGSYPLPTPTSGLYPFTHAHAAETIVVEAPFWLQDQPVTQALFKQYADSIDVMPAGEEKERLVSHLGMFWNRGETSTPAVKGISHEAALDFAQWLQQKTGCHYDVPSREEWLAALIHLYNSGAPLPKPSDAFDRTPLKSLLQGGSEWTRSPCAVGYYLVGEEDWGADSQSNQPICMPGMFSVAGFRMVLHSAPIDPQKGDQTEKTNH
ncbi:MAG: SUMF1/EgtB/PvdO family nonheme iron enzyme [Magnetococcales bacterium]|nr:SUMF1/EgtB/PvdO family nonheme iron enzyme [Magnetococcales bacterium]